MLKVTCIHLQTDENVESSTAYWGADKSLTRPGRKQSSDAHQGHARDFNDVKTRAVVKFFFFLRGKAPKDTHTILTETLACFLPGRAKDLSAALYNVSLWPCLLISHTNAQLRKKLINQNIVKGGHNIVKVLLPFVLPTQHNTSYLLVLYSIRHNCTDKSVCWYIFQYMPPKIRYN